MNYKNILTLLAALIIVAAIAVACGDDTPDSAAPAPPATAIPAAPASAPQAAAPASPASPAPPVAAVPAATAVPVAQATTPPAAPTAVPRVSSPSPQPADMPKLRVVSTSNIVGDWVKRVGGERVSSFSLLPPDADPHTFQPGARDVANVADADVVFTIGLSLEAGWLEELIENAARNHESIMSLGELAEPIEFVDIFDEHGVHEDEHEEDGHDEDEHGTR